MIESSYQFDSGKDPFPLQNALVVQTVLICQCQTADVKVRASEKIEAAL